MRTVLFLHTAHIVKVEIIYYIIVIALANIIRYCEILLKMLISILILDFSYCIIISCIFGDTLNKIIVDDRVP